MLIEEVKDFQVDGVSAKAIYLDGALVWSGGNYAYPQLWGDGLLLATVVPTSTAAVGLSGAGVLSATPVPVVSLSAARTGDGSLLGMVFASYVRSVAFAGDGVLSAAVVKVATADAGLAGAGTLSETISQVYSPALTLVGVGSLSAPILGTYARALALAGDGVLSATKSQVYANTPALSGAGALSATTVKVAPASAALAGVGTLSATATAAGPALTLLGEWGFLGNLNDTSGNGHTGTFTAGSGGSLTYVTGPQANTQAVQFSHQNDVIDLGRTGLEATADGVTVMGWMKINTASAGYVGLLTKARASTSSRLRIGTNTAARNPAYVARWKDDIHNTDTVTPAVDTGWHHYALVDGNTQWALYIDGVLSAANNGSRALNNTTSPVWEAFNWLIGRNATIGDQYADPGQVVSGIRIFQGQATGAQITTWMNTAIVPAVPAPTSSFDWHEGSGATTTSSAGGYALSVTDWALHNGNGPIGPNATVNDWTLAFNVTVTALAETSLMQGNAAAQYYNLNGAGRIGIYPNYSTSGPTIPLNTACLVVFTVVGGTTLNAYINGVLAGPTMSGSYTLNPSSFRVLWDSHAAGQGHTLRYWHGIALTPTQVAALP